MRRQGMFYAARRSGVCSECGEKAKLQSGTSRCDDCINDETCRRVING